MSEKKHEDFFRDTWVRYFGYANEVGESFRTLIPGRLVRLTYKLAFAYVFADTGDKSLKTFVLEGKDRAMIQAGDALIWQSLASVIIPGITINRLCFFTNKLLSKNPKIPPYARAAVTVGVGLVSIPVIIHPIDKAVTALMDVTYRKHF